MRSRILILLLLAGLACFSSVHAAAVAMVAALNSPLWLQQNDNRTRLDQNDSLNIGDRIITGDTGRAVIQLRGKTFLRLDSNSEITFRAMRDSAYPELYVHRGRACVNYTAGTGDPAKFEINLGNAMFASIQLRGDVCVLRLQPLSAIRLYAGSVELTHAVGPDRIILSEAGTEFHIRDDGSYELLLPDDNNLSILEMAQPFIVEETVEENAVEREIVNEPVEPTEDSGATIVETLVTTEPETSTQETVSAYVYTVYLFSTREEEKARQVNQRFQKAGHETQIITGTDNAGTRYRIAATGFESRDEAQSFSDSIVGTLGVTGTWIGKDSR